MFTLKLFGGVALTALDGVVSGRAAQKRRLVLLARLALAPERTLSRDKLIGLLWPDTDGERARHLLSVSLHELRRSLGEDVIIGRADDLTLNPSILTTDVEQFETVLRQDQPEQAVRLYSGPFMDGFFSSDGPDLDHWIEGERSRLARAYATALERCAALKKTEGDLTGAVEYWRRLAVLDPYNARVARELMLALDAAGDRAGALQHARVHTIMLREEFSAQPDAEIVTLAERLRAAPIAAKATRAVPPPVPPASTAAVPESQSHPVLVHTDATLPSKTRVPTGVSVRPSTRRLRRVAVRYPWLLALVSVLVTVAVARLIRVLRPPPVLQAMQPENSIAVLPFRHMVPSEEMEFFGMGVSEEIRNALGRLGKLFVPSTTSSYALRDTEVRQIGERLRVRYVLEGSVNRGGGRLIVNATLIDARTGAQEWTQPYDLAWDAANVLSVQNLIANAVVQRLAVSLGQEFKAAQLVRPGTKNPQALELYWKARPHYFARRAASLDTALQYLRAAVKADSTYALAWAGIADAYVIMGAFDYGVMKPDSAFRAARVAAERAIRLDATLAEPRAALATFHSNHDWNWKAAKREFEIAIALNPGYAQAYQWYGLFLATQGREEEAIAAITRARELDPESPMVAAAFARQLYLSRKFAESIRVYHDVLQQDPAYVTAHAGIGLAFVANQQPDSALVHYGLLSRKLGGQSPLVHGLMAHAAGLAGRRAEAEGHRQELIRSMAKTYVPHEYMVLANIGVGDRQGAIRSLEQAYKEGSGGVAYIAVEPAVDQLREERGFQALMRKLRL